MAKNRSVRNIVFIVVLAVAAVLAVFFTKTVFSANAKKSLERVAQVQVLRFESQLNAEMKLVLQMAKSPLVVRYLENPNDPAISKIAYDELAKYQGSFLSNSSFWISAADRKFYSDLAYSYTVDPEDPDQYWYKMTLYETDVYNFNINYNPDLKKTSLWLNAVVRNARGEAIAIAGTGIPISDFVNDMFASLDTSESFRMFTFNEGLEITGAADQKLVESKKHIDDEIPALKGHTASSNKVRFVSAPKGEYILFPMGGIGWTLVLEAPYNFRAFMQSAALPFGLLLLVAVVVGLAMLAASVFNPLVALNSTVDKMKSGNADLTQRIDMRATGSLPIIRQLVDGFNQFIAKIQETVKSLKDSELQLEISRQKLNEGTQKTVQSIEEINSGIGLFNGRIEEQLSTVNKTASEVDAISGNINAMNRLIGEQNAAVSNASSAVEEMLGNIKSVDESVERLTTSFAALEQNANDGMAKHENMDQMIAQIRDESDMLAEANSVISSIAEQTNLLAMNAAIEAAHAGDAGRGFSVVADEIRKLSENSSEQSKAISQKLSDIQKSIEGVVVASAEAGESFRGVSEKINDTNTLVQQIASAMTEQEKGSQQIYGSLSMLNDSSAEVQGASGKMASGSRTVLDEMQVLQGTSDKMRAGMQDLDGKSLAMKGNQDAFLGVVKEMDAAIDLMRGNLEMFKV